MDWFWNILPKTQRDNTSTLRWDAMNIPVHLPDRLRWAKFGRNDVIRAVFGGGMVEKAYDVQLVNA